MNAKRVTWTAILLLVTAMLGGAYLIVGKNRPADGATQEAPAGFMH